MGEQEAARTRPGRSRAPEILTGAYLGVVALAALVVVAGQLDPEGTQGLEAIWLLLVTLPSSLAVDALFPTVTGLRAAGLLTLAGVLQALVGYVLLVLLRRATR